MNKLLITALCAGALLALANGCAVVTSGGAEASTIPLHGRDSYTIIDEQDVVGEYKMYWLLHAIPLHSLDESNTAMAKQAALEKAGTPEKPADGLIDVTVINKTIYFPLVTYGKTTVSGKPIELK